MQQVDIETTNEGQSSWRDKCLAVVKQLYPNEVVVLTQYQGGCSTTMTVTETLDSKLDYIVQCRALPYAVNATIAMEARQVYGKLVPSTEVLTHQCIGGITHQILKMPRLPGAPYSTIAPKTEVLDRAALQRLKGVVDGVAGALAQSLSWRRSPADCTGRIGSTLRSRLQSLARSLPGPDLRQVAARTAMRVEAGELDALPVVLTHGDLLPSNILVDTESGCVTALIDWAEAEWLPFGMCLYGLDHLLGFSNGVSFTYFSQAASLRARFWSALIYDASELGELQLLRSVRLARTTGILLWHGFAWDNGKIDRVVNAENDTSELAYLRALLIDETSECSRS